MMQLQASLREGKHLASETRTTAVVVDGLALEGGRCNTVIS